jgi:hypothetical protein
MRRVLACLLVVALAAPDRPTTACSHPPPSPVFVVPGPVRVLEPGPLAVTYLRLRGRRLTRSQRHALAAAEPVPAVDARAAWLDARRRITPQLRSWEWVENDRSTGVYSWYRNCLDDAFRTAADTLWDRAAQWGPGDPRLLEWARGQDVVFENCGNRPLRLPEPVAPDGDRDLAADRDYQTAAARFYAGQFEQAQVDFRAIAEDPFSPWRATAALLVARTLVRRGTLTHVSFLEPAERELRGILARGDLKSVHPSATRLLGFVRLRRDPTGLLAESAATVLTTTDATALRGALRDFEATCCSSAGVASLAGESRHLAEFVMAVQHGRQELALQRWDETHGTPWLVALLTTLDPSHPRAAEMAAAARALPADHPGHLTSTYHAARLLALSDPDAARALLDGLLSAGPEELPYATRNIVLDLRQSVAHDLRDLLRVAPRSSIGTQWSGFVPGGGDLPALDERGLALLQGLPLDSLREAALDEALPANIRSVVARLAWTRAALLERNGTAVELAGVVARLSPDLAEGMGRFVAARDRATRRLALVRVLRREQRPWFLASWSIPWTSKPLPQAATLDWTCVSPPTLRARFLTAAQATEAADEIARLDALGSIPELASRVAVQYAREHSHDPSAAKELHLAVVSTSRGCASPTIGPASREAFRNLHDRYGGSAWAQRTPYWYAGR